MSNYEPQVNAYLGVADVSFPEAALETAIIAQGTSTGSYTSGALVENIGNDPEVWKSLAGVGSQAYAAIEAFKSINKKTKLHAIIVSDNGSGVVATGSAVFTGTPTASGSLFVTIGSYPTNTYELVITTASTPTTIGDDLVAQITADIKSPITAVNTTGNVALTSRNKGTEFNKINLVCDGTVAGVSVALTAFASGATDSVITTPLALLNNKRTDIVFSENNLGAIKTHLDAKFNVANKVIAGVGIFVKTDTYANVITSLAPATLASINIIQLNDAKIADTLYKGSSILELDIVKASKFAAMRALRSYDGALISSFMEAGNTIGGSHTFGLPYYNMKMIGSPVIRTGKGFTEEQIEAIKELGGSTFGNSGDNSYLVTNQVLTTAFKKETPTALGYTYRTLCDRDVFGFCRKYIFDMAKKVYAQSKLTNGDVSTNNKEIINNEKTIRSEIKNAWVILSGADYNLLQNGTAAEADFDSNLAVQVDTATGTVNVSMVLQAIGQADIFNFTLTPKK